MKAASWAEPSSAGSDSATQSQVDIVGMLRRRLWLIVFGGLIGFGLGYLYFTKQIPLYQSSSRILVVRERTSSELPIRGVGEAREAGYESDVTAALLIRSPLVVGDAVKKNDLENLPPFVGMGDPTDVIIGNLGVSVVGGRGTVLDLTYRGTDAKSCGTILKAVIGSYHTFLGTTHESIAEETVKLIRDAKDVLLKQLGEKEAAYRQFREDAPLLWNANDEAAQNIHKSRLRGIESIRSELLISRTQTKAQRQAIESALARGENREALLLMTGRSASANSEYASAATTKEADMSPESELFPLLLQEQVLLEDHGPDHPKVLSLQHRIELTRQHLTQKLIEKNQTQAEEAQEASPTEHQDFLAILLNSLQQEIFTSEEKERELNLLFERERESARSLAVYEVKDATFQADLKRTQALFDSVRGRLEEINLMKSYGGFKMEVISPAHSGLQVEPNRNRILTMGIVFGLLGGLALAFLAEISDRTFRNPDDVSEYLGLPVVGHIPDTRPAKKPKDSVSKLSPMLLAYFEPKSRWTEACRAIRTVLYFSTRGEEHKVIQITSPNPGDGKTTLSVNLAICIAQSGKTVLLIDADFRRPRTHMLLGLENEVGISSAIMGKAELMDAIQCTEVENLWSLPCGPRPENPAELLTSQRFDELLAILREKYDFVLIDTPPVLAVTDPGTVASRVDGVLMTIRISKRTRSESKRAAALLKSLGANILGVIVNRIGGQPGYGYGKHSSSRYTNYRYADWYANDDGYGYLDHLDDSQIKKNGASVTDKKEHSETLSNSTSVLE